MKKLYLHLNETYIGDVTIESVRGASTMPRR